MIFFKHRLILFLLITFLISCKSEEEKLIERLTPVLERIVIQDSIVTKVDSLKIFKIDTLTDLDITKRNMERMQMMSDFYLYVSQMHATMVKSHLSSARLNQNKSIIFNELNSLTLAKMSIDNSKEDISKASEELKKATIYKDSAQLMRGKYEALNLKVKTGKIDSVTLRGYIPRFKLVGSNRKGVEVKQDSMYVFLSESLNLVPINIK